MKPFIPQPFSSFLNFSPFHNIIHYYVDLSTFLISSGNIILSPKDWWALNRRKRVTSLYSLEVQYGGPHVRDQFTQRCFREMRSKKKTVCGDRMGFKDFFVPILSKGRILGCLQAGAFAQKAIDLEMLSKCWKEMTGREVSPTQTEFREFTRTLLEIPVLDGHLFSAFQESLELFARLLSGEGDEESIGLRLQELQTGVFAKGLPHSYWLEWALGRPTNESVPPWHRNIENWGWIKDEIRLTRIPTTVLTVIAQGQGRTELDWTGEMLRIYRFQRECFRFAQTLPETVGGKLEDYGAVFVTSADPKLPRLAQRKWIEGIAQKIRDFARKELKCPALVGVGETVAAGEPLNPTYRQAVLALHLWKGSEKDIVFFNAGKKGTVVQGGFSDLRQVMDELQQAFGSASFSGLEALQESFLKQAIQLSFQNPHEIRWHFEYALDRLAERVGTRMDLGKKETGLLKEGTSRLLEEAATLQEMVLAFQEALSKLRQQVERPLATQRDHSVDKVREYLEGHFKESLPIKRLAGMAGTSVSTFSRRFRKLTGLGLEAYLQKRRLDEAKRLLKATRLPIFRIAKDCGFKSNPHFIQLFRRKTGSTPQVFRQNFQGG